MIAADGVHFRVWSPSCKRIEVVSEAVNGTAAMAARELESEDGGCVSGALSAAQAGMLYRFRINGCVSLIPIRYLDSNLRAGFGTVVASIGVDRRSELVIGAARKILNQVRFLRLHDESLKHARSVMRLKEFINYQIETIGPEDTLQQAAEKMRDFDIGSIPVCDATRVLGMVTDRDITIRAAANGDDPTITTVSEVMTPEIVCCYEHQTVEEAAALMQQHQIRRLFVLNESDELIGIISLGELATATGNRQLAGETLERVSDYAAVPPDQEQDLSDADEETSMHDGALATETRVAGLFDNAEQAREAIEELKVAGFADYRMAAAMQNSAAQDSFIAETKVHTAAVEEIPSIPHLDAGQVLLLVDAADQAALALEIINRNQGVTGGVRMPT